MPTLRVVKLSLVGLVAAAGALSGCASSPHAAPDQVTDHAVRAGSVLTQGHGPLPARAAAGEVVGAAGDTTISAVELHGTTWGGTVTLRITVVHTDSWGAAHSVTGCFRYAFSYPRGADRGTPHRMACRGAQALPTNVPPLPAGVTEQTRQTVVRRLAAFRAADADPAQVRAALSAALGGDYTIQVTGRPLFVWIRYGEQCLTAHAAGSTIQVGRPMRGTDCFGG